jgi:hypothetical protein
MKTGNTYWHTNCHSLKEVEEITEIKADNLRQRIHRGTLKATKMGRDWFITDNELLSVHTVDILQKQAHVWFVKWTNALRKEI